MNIRSEILLAGIVVAGAAACGSRVQPFGADGDGDASSGDNTPSTSAAVTGGGAEATTQGTPEPACTPASGEALTNCVDPAAYEKDLRFIAAPRPPASEHWQAVQDLCADRFAALGYTVELQAYPTGVNVIGRKPGTLEPQREVVVAAHYDHIPGCDGADDNASGVAGVLEVARVLAAGTFERTLTVACWDQEEIGLIGSRAFVNAAGAGSVVVNFDLEMIGYASSKPETQDIPLGFDALFVDAYTEVAANEFRGDFIAFVADDLAREAADALERHADRLELPNVWLELGADLKNSPLLGDLQRSDHASFWDEDIPAIMITDTANFRNANYHCVGGEDSVDLLDHAFATKVIAATVGAAADVLGNTR